MNSDRHKNLVPRFHQEMWNRGEAAIVDELFAPNYVRHDLRPGTPPAGPEGQKEIARLFRAAFPDLHMRVDVIVADEAYVVVRWTMRGTHLGEWAGIKPTGRKIEFSGVNIFRFEHGKVAELMPASRLNFSTPKCEAVPMPVEPNLSAPGFAFAAATSSRTVVMPAALPATRT